VPALAQDGQNTLLAPFRCTAGVLREGETRFSDGTTPTASHGALQVSEKTAEGVQSGCTFTTHGTLTLS